MWKDEIINEIHRVREEIATRCGGDMEAIGAELKRLADEGEQATGFLPSHRAESVKTEGETEEARKVA